MGNGEQKPTYFAGDSVPQRRGAGRRRLAAKVVLAIWIGAAATTILFGLAARVSPTNHEGLVVLATALAAPTSWVFALAVIWLSISNEFFSSSGFAWIIWGAGIAGSSLLQLSLLRWAGKRVPASATDGTT